MNYSKRKIGKLLLVLTIGLIYSCANEVNFRLPQGPKGDKGESAYELWKAEVEKGLDDPKNPGTKWPVELNELQHFFLYLTGKNGINGVNGKDGKSAYEIWKDEVTSRQIDWSQDQTEIEDFWRYLKGKDGKEGKNAYEIWKDEVAIGNIVDKDGNKWKAEDTQLINFWEYLKGRDGKNGTDGNNGAEGRRGTDGLSAYEVWKNELATTGLTDPFNPGQIWDPNKNTSADFWAYLSGKNGNNGKDGADGEDGADGDSAYELWVSAVTSPSGLVDPKSPTGENCSIDKITETDFWAYLRGIDGKDGRDGKDGEDGKPGEPGSSGVTVVVIDGYFNVIAQYSNQSYSEYIDPLTGSVTYKVYDKVGAIAPGAVVKGLPGIGQDKEYIADASGYFTVEKEDLPTELPITSRHGTTASVTYNGVTEVSARNTYVPNRMQIRIASLGDPHLNGFNLLFKLKVERKTDVTENWERMPSYLGSMSQSMIAYEVDAKTGPVPYNETVHKLWTSAGVTLNNDISVYVPRNTIRCNYISEDYQEKNYGGIWDGNQHYICVMLKSYYGETPVFNAIAEIPPIQMMPLLKDLIAYGYDNIRDTFLDGIAGNFNIDQIDYNHMYNYIMTPTDINDNAKKWDASKVDFETFGKTKGFELEFSKQVGSTNTSVNNSVMRSSIQSPSFHLELGIPLESTCNLYSRLNHYFRSYDEGFMILIKTSSDPDVFVIKAIDEDIYPDVTPIPVKVE